MLIKYGATNILLGFGFSLIFCNIYGVSSIYSFFLNKRKDNSQLIRDMNLFFSLFHSIKYSNLYKFLNFSHHQLIIKIMYLFSFRFFLFNISYL